MSNEPKKVVSQVADELAKWKPALMNALTERGFVPTFRDLNSGFRIAQITVVRPSNPDERYQIDFQSGVTTTGRWVDGNVTRTARCVVECHSGRRSLRFKGFSHEKVGMIVQHAEHWIDSRIQRDVATEAKRKRSTIARTIWNEAKLELPDWMSVIANTECDADVGTFILSFHEHRANYGLKRLTPPQIARIAGYIAGVIAEPPVGHPEQELITKLLQHEGKLPV